MASVRPLSRACKGAAIRRWYVGGRPLFTPCASSSSIYRASRHEHQRATGITHRICVVTLENGMSSRGLNGEFFRGFAQQVDLDDAADDDEANMSNDEAEAEEDGDNGFSILWKKLETQKLRPRESIQTIQEWQAQGNKLTKTTLGRALTRLNSRRHYLQAFEIMKWVAEENLVEFNEKDHALHITMACRANRPGKAQRIFDDLPAEMRTEGVQGALIGGLAGRNLVSKAEQRMEELKLSSAQTGTMMILMYLRENMDDKVPGIIKKMKESGLALNTFTYSVLLKHKDRLGGLEGIEEEAEAALNKIDVEDPELKQNVLGNMMAAYGYLGKAEKVEKIWSIIKQLSWMRSSSYLAAMSAFGQLGEVEKAEKVFEELVAAKIGLARPYAVMLGIYAELGLMDKAEQTMTKLNELQPKLWFGAYNDLISGYLAKKQPAKALRKLQEGYEVAKGNVRPDYRTTIGMMPVFASEKDVAGAEKLVKFFGHRRDAKMYNELLKVYFKAKKPAGKFEARMRGSGVEPDQKTMELLKKLELVTTEEAS